MLYLLKALESLIMTDSDKFEKKSLKIFATVFYQMLMDYFFQNAFKYLWFFMYKKIPQDQNCLILLWRVIV